MIIQCDVKSLELVVVAYLSQDSVMMKEIIDKVDLHENNRKAFDLPTRLIAKTYIFRLVYGGSAWAYTLDHEFSGVMPHLPQKKRVEYWQSVIDTTYQKYQDVADWHKYIIHEAQTTGKVTCPTGRFFPFSPVLRKGEHVWPVTTIKNYPVQGTGADLVSLARVDFLKQFKKEQINGKLISSVHDSLVCDVHPSHVQETARLLSGAVSKVPQLFEERFGEVFNLPMTAEILVGPNMEDMTEIKLDIQ